MSDVLKSGVGFRELRADDAWSRHDRGRVRKSKLWKAMMHGLMLVEVTLRKVDRGNEAGRPWGTARWDPAIAIEDLDILRRDVQPTVCRPQF